MEKTTFSDLVCVGYDKSAIGDKSKVSNCRMELKLVVSFPPSTYEAPVRPEQELSNQQELFYQQEADNGAGLDHDFHSDF